MPSVLDQLLALRAEYLRGPDDPRPTLFAPPPKPKPRRISPGNGGVYLTRPGRWVARIPVNGKRTYLGLFGTKGEAEEAVKRAREGGK